MELYISCVVCLECVLRGPSFSAWGRFPPSPHMETLQTAFRRIRSIFPPKCTWTGLRGGSADPTLPPLATVFLWHTAWWVLKLVRRWQGFVGQFGLVCGPLLHVLRRTRSSASLSVYSSCFLLIPDLCSWKHKYASKRYGFSSFMNIVNGYISHLMTVNTDVASSLFHPRIECSWDFYNMQFVYKSILSPLYDLYYESG